MGEPVIGVIGAGIMGSGIAQTLAQSGYSAVCCDVSDEVIERARESVTRGRYVAIYDPLRRETCGSAAPRAGGFSICS